MIERHELVILLLSGLAIIALAPLFDRIVGAKVKGGRR